ncbi:DNA topoisomerase 1 [Geodia barretti]|uniref:DNA topoisomerase n=1 Tax=Geodia barretti TaxID=519541 RepID=A0AA35WPK1_GEOBA|nr:DNA topoisomerase 1 [Geodia barretti]
MEERDYPDIVSRSALKKWGWTDTLIDRYLGDPDELGTNPISPSGPDVKYYKKERIQETERRSEVKEALVKVLEKRNGSALGTDRKTPSRASSPKRGKTSQRGARDSIAHRIGAASGKRLVIVESPAKARTVGQILGNRYVVTASQGHVRDLPKGKMGVDLDNDFEPSYVTMRDKMPLVKEIKRAGDEAADIYLATDPDREGEAISWHLQTAAGWDKATANPPKRVVFHEITKDAVEEAFKHPREIDMKLVNAQQARRILDRLVGYQISPLLGKRVQRGTSAGRVQSVSLRLVTDREKEIQAFIPVESWSLDAELHKAADQAALHSIKGNRQRLTISAEEEARGYESELKEAAYAVAEVRKREVRQRPAAPFTTSTLQQEAGRKLRFTAQRTMSVAQQLYEGLTVGSEGSVGLITYMRTDSVQVAETAVQEARLYIGDKYGKDYLPDKPRAYRTRTKSAQEAHEAIRPTAIGRSPDSLKPYLTTEQFRLYGLIWARMLASQMADALSDATTVNIDAACKPLADGGSVLKFPGFRTLYMEGKDEGDAEEASNSLPELAVGDALNCNSLEANQHFTQPPPRFTEATLVKAMEERGIGRPSTYAPTIGVLLARNYVSKENNSLHPSLLGTTVSDLLTQFFTDIMDPDFTAYMEEKLDEVSQGEREWVPMLQEFYGPFAEHLDNANENMPRVKPEDEATDEVCENCEKPMVIKTGRFGRFMACTGYPQCRTTRQIKETAGAKCPLCDGDLVERGSRRGVFYGCSNYPECKYTNNRRPLPDPCPECDGLMVGNRDGSSACTVCAWKAAAPEATDAEASGSSQEQELATVGD